IGSPLAAAILVPWYAMTHGIGAGPIWAGLALWALTGLSITVGYHRLFSHRSFKAPAPVRLLFVIFGAAAWQNSVIAWSAAHRFHHRHVDTDHDPYNAKRGFIWSHLGWVLVEGPQHNEFGNVPDLWNDPICAWQHRNYMKISIAVNVGVPLLLGLLFGDIAGMLLVAGLLRVVVIHHITFCINSFAHIIGTQPWDNANSSRDNWVLSLVTFGEGYHNYHHAFQGDYRNGTLWYNFDPSKWTIWSLARVGLATDLRRTPADVVMKHRFAGRSRALRLWMDDVSRRMEAWSGRMKEDHKGRLDGVQERLESAQMRLEQSFEELTASRKRWALAVREHRAQKREATREEMKALRRSFRARRRVAKIAMREWEEHFADYMRLTAQPTLA
ncbi:MAG: fatty acid desaturase, partial [Myxococcota bacterium]|nr:fatty acid desaturase [Myxococcota bacterium]